MFNSLNLTVRTLYWCILISRRGQQFDNSTRPYYQNDPYNKLTHKMLCITCKDKAGLAAIQRTTDLCFMPFLNGKSGILLLMITITNCDILLFMPALYHIDISKL